LIPLLRIALVTVLSVVTTACTATYPTGPTKGRPVGLYLAYTGPKGRTAPGTFGLANAYGFIAYTIDADGAYERVTDRSSWSSSDDGIVRAQSGVSTSGVKNYTAVGAGDATVVARLQGLEATAPVLVVANEVMTRTPRVDLTWSGANTIGASSKASALYRPPSGNSQDVSNFATWTSSDPEVATVTAGGKIRALRRGTTIITANVDGMVDWFWFSVLPAS
jgi:hypothetical protein